MPEGGRAYLLPWGGVGRRGGGVEGFWEVFSSVGDRGRLRLSQELSNWGKEGEISHEDAKPLVVRTGRGKRGGGEKCAQKTCEFLQRGGSLLSSQYRTKKKKREGYGTRKEKNPRGGGRFRRRRKKGGGFLISIREEGRPRDGSGGTAKDAANRKTLAYNGRKETSMGEGASLPGEKQVARESYSVRSCAQGRTLDGGKEGNHSLSRAGEEVVERKSSKGRRGLGEGGLPSSTKGRRLGGNVTTFLFSKRKKSARGKGTR